MSQTKSQLIEGSAASELTAAKTLLGAGSAGAPSLTATGDTNTGIFFPTADTIAPLLTAALQEAVAEIKALKARVTALEARSPLHLCAWR
jgi:hypothetical protein